MLDLKYVADAYCPAIVIGYWPHALVHGAGQRSFDETKRRDNEVAAAVHAFERCPPWLLSVSEQTGGYACNNVALMGCVLSLDANRDKALHDPAELIHRLRLEKPIAASPNPPEREHITFTSGFSFNGEQLQFLQSLLEPCFKLPKLKQGSEEAFLLFEPASALDYFRDWKMLSVHLREDQVPARSRFQDSSAEVVVSDDNIEAWQFSHELRFDDAAYSALKDLGERIGYPQEPDVFLLWVNCD